jgi:hypothetical protein
MGKKEIKEKKNKIIYSNSEREGRLFQKLRKSEAEGSSPVS